MQVWLRDPNTCRLARSSSPLKSEPKSDPVMPLPTSLQDRFYPMRTSLPSCIRFLEANGNNFVLNPQFINTLPKFHGLESDDAYFFKREFEKVCLMMRIHQLGDDVVRLHFVPFALKDLAKKWLYGLVVDSFSFSFCLVGDLICGILCMQVWSRYPITSRLTKTSLPKSESKPDPVMALPTSL